MKIIILGSGKIGSLIAENLSSEKQNEVIIVDNDKDQLSYLNDKYDVMTMVGNASSPELLSRIGANEADVLIAVTSNDEVNMIASKFASELFNVPKIIARIRNNDYIANKDAIFNKNIIPVDYLVNPEFIVREALYNIVNYQGLNGIEFFDNDKVTIARIVAQYGGANVGKRIEHISDQINTKNFHIIAIYRKGQSIKITKYAIIEAGDEVVFTCLTKDLREKINIFQRVEKKIKHIMIAGGGRLSENLTKKLIENNYRVKIIEKNLDNATNLSKRINNCLIINGDATDEELLYNERIDMTDLFISCTNNDDINMLSALLAKKNGANKVISLIEKSSYKALSQNTDIDILFSSQQAITSVIQSNIRGGSVEKIIDIGRNNIQSLIMEISIGSNLKDQNIINLPFSQIKLPSNCYISFISRAGELLEVKDNLVITLHDNLFIRLSSPKHAMAVSNIFATLDQDTK